ncbi:large-conductance mechanosensitive channel protein MscL [Dehalobacter sp. DCM]|uniref:large-conductance mechanosensitive channel protein MscL n=1 Tax=Dehalobacter sp. DCM TaxID=2907827 RepID=UPI0030818403|nr:large-conductance mechanosensitive channel protein MscL [Dehalobacter sp. DCM]
MFQEFKQFIMKGNVVDLAVAVIIGGAFGKIVTSLVNDIIMPLLGLILGKINFTELKWVIVQGSKGINGSEGVKEVAVLYGTFIQSVVDFLIIALAIFFMLKALSKLKRKKEVLEETPAPPEPSNEEVLLAEIRDLLKARNK